MEGAATSLEDVNNNDENLDCFEYTGDNTKACVVAIKAKRSWIVLIIIISFCASVLGLQLRFNVVGSSAAVVKRNAEREEFRWWRTIFIPMHQKKVC